MKWIIFTVTLAITVILFTVLLASSGTIKSLKQTLPGADKIQTMTITSSAFEHNHPMPSKYTCDGSNINPSLSFTQVPKEAESLVLLVDDPDAVSGIWHHWIVYNMESTVSEIPENASTVPGSEGITSFGKSGYGGPCPPSGKHRYFFKLLALDIKLELPEGATYNEFQSAIENHIIDQAELIGLYSRVN